MLPKTHEGRDRLRYVFEVGVTGRMGVGVTGLVASGRPWRVVAARRCCSGKTAL